MKQSNGQYFFRALIQSPVGNPRSRVGFFIRCSVVEPMSFASSLPFHQVWMRRVLSATLTLLVCLVITSTGRAQTCTPGNTNPSVTVCSPTLNAIVSTPTHVIASTTDSHPVTAVQIYVDNALVTQVNAASIDTYINLSLGSHLVTVQGWDNTGATFKTNVPVAMTPPCALSTKNQSITVCTPVTGALVSSPVHLVAGITDSNPVPSIQVTVDRKLIYQTNAGVLDAYLTSISAGKHSVKITAQRQHRRDVQQGIHRQRSLRTLGYRICGILFSSYKRIGHSTTTSACSGNTAYPKG